MIGPDTPLRLATAARLAYPDGGMTGRGLAHQARQGALAIERVNGKLYTTLADIQAMRARCRIEAKAPGSGSDQPTETPTAGSTRIAGLFETDQIESVQDALGLTVSGLKKRSPPILRKSISAA